MPISFHPKYGQVIYCDFTTGFREPEMVKYRPVVVISRANSQVCTVVPLSGTEPLPMKACNHKMSRDSLPVRLSDKGDWWAKCDMICTVGFFRLDRIKEGKDANGKRLYSTKCVSAKDLRAIHQAILHSICLNHLTWPPE